MVASRKANSQNCNARRNSLRTSKDHEEIQRERERERKRAKESMSRMRYCRMAIPYIMLQVATSHPQSR